MQLPAGVVADQYWKRRNGTWIDATSIASFGAGGVVTLSITDGGPFDDDGQAFDPRKPPALQPTNSLAQASVGGRGLMLVRAAARRIDYERTLDGHNRLTVTLPRP